MAQLFETLNPLNLFSPKTAFIIVFLHNTIRHLQQKRFTHNIQITTYNDYLLKTTI